MTANKKGAATKNAARPAQPTAKVGIFMPCYNLGEYIEEALDSLYIQTYQGFITVIADDASPNPDTIPVLKKIDRPRAQIFYEKKNMGLTAICNKYMQRLDAEYIMMFSPDDTMHPDYLKELVAYLDSHPDVAAACSWIQEFEGGTELLQYSEDLCKLPEMLVENHFSGAALMRKSAWLKAGMHDEDPGFKPNLDYELWLSMLRNGENLGVVPKTLFYWRILRDSLSHGVDDERVLTFRKAVLNKYGDLYQKYSNYTTNYYLETICRFEKYYHVTQEGHAWLDTQYKNITKLNAELQAELDSSIRRPYVRSAYQKVRKHLSR